MSGFARLESVEGFCSAPVADASALLPDPWGFFLLVGEAAKDGDSMRCFRPEGSVFEGLTGRSSEAAIAFRSGDKR